MLFEILFPLSDQFQIFNIFRYITFRTGGAILTSLIISFILAPSIISFLRNNQLDGQPIRKEGPENHLITKKGTPTMGGTLILLALTISTIAWMDFSNLYLWLLLFITWFF